MVVRIAIALFASLVAGLSYLTGLTRLMTGLLLGFGAFASGFLGILCLLPMDSKRLVFPIYEQVPAWPYFLIALILAMMVGLLFLVKDPVKATYEEVGSRHFTMLFWGIAGYLASLFLPSMYLFPSDARALAASDLFLLPEVLGAALVFIVGVSISCRFFYLASKGASELNNDLMRRFVLALFTFFQLDKMPLLMAYLLLYSPQTGQVFTHIAALTLTAYIPVGVFLLKTSWDCRSS